MQAQKGLYDFLQILNSPDMYPDISGAGFLLSPALAIASSIVAYLGVFALVFVLLRIGADVILMAGLGSMLESGKTKSIKSTFFSFSSFKGKDISDDAFKYIKDYAWKHLIMIAFIGLMISGQLFPLAGTLTATTGAVISKIADINPVPYIESVDLDLNKLADSLDRMSVNELMKGHTKYTSHMTAALQRLNSKEDLTDEEYDEIAKAYANAYDAAERYATQIKSKVDDFKTRTDDEPLTDAEKDLRAYDRNSHKDNIDHVLLDNGHALQ